MSTSKTQTNQHGTEDEASAVNKSQIGNNSQISSTNNDDDQLIRVNISFFRELTWKQTKTHGNVEPLKTETPAILPTKDQQQQQNTKNIALEIGEYKRLTRRQQLAVILNSRCMDWFFIGLIVIYMGLVFADLIIDSGCVTNPGLLWGLQILRYIEISVVSFFILELVFKSIAMGLKQYFKDCWYIIDAVIIFTTFGLVIVDICTQGDVAGLSQLRGIFRLFRIFLLYRKATTFTRVAKKRIQPTGFNIKSPVEKVLDLLESLRRYTKDKETLQEVTWAIDIVSSNKLYDVIIDKGAGHEGNKEVNEWIQSYGTKVLDPEKQIVRKQSIAPRDGSLSRVPSAINSLPQEVSEFLKTSVLEFSFDVFKFNKIVPGHELSSLMYYLFDKLNLFEGLEVSTAIFTKFARKIQDGYRANPYHNALHATDVLQTVAYMTITCGFKDSAELDELELATSLIAAAIHDYDHPGFNNVFHVNSQHELAIRYNDKAVLENYHVAATYMILKDQAFNIFSNLNTQDYKAVREKLINLVLATDMSQHFSEFALLKTRLASDFDKKQKDKLLCLKMILHSADISNPAKPWLICEEWANRCLQEFWAQGDLEREKGLPISYLCDRFTTNTSKSQVGFMDIFVQPTWEIMSQLLSGLELSHFEINKGNWKAREARYDEELSTFKLIESV